MTPEERQAERRKRIRDFKLEPDVKIKLKGAEYTLELNNFALIEILKETGHNLMDVGFGPAQMSDPVLLSAILYWGLKTHHPDLKREDSDRLYSIRQFPFVLSYLQEALDLIIPDVSDLLEVEGGQEDKDKDPTRKPLLNGSVTGPSPTV